MSKEINQFIKKRQQANKKQKKIRASFVVLPDQSLAEQINANEPQFVIHSPKSKLLKNLEAVKTAKDYIYPVVGDLVKKEVIKFPTQAQSYGNVEVLREEIKLFIHDYLDIHSFYEELASYYVLLTWLYDRLSTITYLGIMGDYGSGKTRAAQTIGSICYKPAFVSGSLTCAPIYRILEQSRGTLVINEFDFKESDMGSELIKILNNGYEKGMHVLRVKSDTGEVEAFDAYGPKIFTFRKRKKDQAFESRLITIPVEETSREDIPITLPQAFEERALLLRNKLLMFRFDNFYKQPVVDPTIFEGIERRLRQTLYPLLTVVDDDRFLDKLKKFIGDYQQQAVIDRSMGWLAENLQALIELTLGTELVTVGDFATKMNEGKSEGDKKMSARGAGSIARKHFKLKTRRISSGDRKGEYEIILDQPKLRSMCLRHGVDIPPESSLYSPSSPQPDQVSVGREQSEDAGNARTVGQMSLEEMKKALS